MREKSFSLRQSNIINSNDELPTLAQYLFTSGIAEVSVTRGDKGCWADTAAVAAAAGVAEVAATAGCVAPEGVFPLSSEEAATSTSASEGGMTDWVHLAGMYGGRISSAM